MPQHSRKTRFQSRFEAALKRADMSLREWCRLEDAPCTRHHLYECFAGRREMNDEIRDAIERFIEKHPK